MTDFNHGDLLITAGAMALKLTPYCERLAIAGSLRRGQARVDDIDIVCISKPSLDAFLNGLLDAGVVKKALNKNGHAIAWGGKRYVMLYHDNYLQADIKIEVYVTTAEQWGYSLLLRTGGAMANKMLVKQKVFGGACRDDVLFAGGFVWWLPRTVDQYAPNELRIVKSDPKSAGAVRLKSETELQVYQAAGLPYFAPNERGRDIYLYWANMIDLTAVMHAVNFGASLYRVDSSRGIIEKRNETGFTEYALPDDILKPIFRSSAARNRGGIWCYTTPPNTHIYMPNRLVPMTQLALLVGLSDLIEMRKRNDPTPNQE